MTNTDMHQHILEAATRLFVERGYHGIAMREIAEASGVSKAGLYYYFRDKEELFVAILSSYLNQLEQSLTLAIASGDTARERLTGIVRAIFAQPASQRQIMRLASNDLAHLSPEARISFSKRYYAGFIGQIEASIKQGIENGELRPLDSATMTWALLGIIYPFFSNPGAYEKQSSAELISSLLTVFFDGATQLRDA